MLIFYNVKFNWLYVILFAVSAQIYYIYRYSTFIDNEDANSAIKRAKTSSCKAELQEFATRISKEQMPLLNLRRSCKLDQNINRNKRVGCFPKDTKGLIKLDERATNSTVCLDQCFSYGHAYGGFDNLASDCYCGNDKSEENHVSEGNCTLDREVDWYKVNHGIYQPSKPDITLLSAEGRRNKTIRIAFLLILNGRSDLHIRRLLNNIYVEHHLYYLHIDKRNHYLFNKLSPLAEEFENVIVTKSRFNTIWGGPSLLRMIMDAMKYLSQYDWDYLINLSESDFPIKPLRKVESYLAKNLPTIFLKTHSIKGYNFIKKQGLDHNFYQCEDRVWRMGKRKLPRGIIWSGGSDWFALPRDFCSYIIDNLTNSKDLVKPLMHLYNYTLLPAESFFHTLALNSNFCDKIVDNNLRLTNWSRKRGCKCQHKEVVDWCGCSPLVYRTSDWSRLQQTNVSSDLMFSRKFDPTISSSIIYEVENKLVADFNSKFVHVNYTTKFWQNILSMNRSIDLPDSSYDVMHQFALFSLKQVRHELAAAFNNRTKLRSIDLFFDEDRFVGWIFKFCNLDTCFKLLVEKNDGANLRDYSGQCFRSNDGRILRVIEINHDFDIGERMFRNYKPMYHESNIVVYHEWSVSKPKKTNDNVTDHLRFEWHNPKNQLELSQIVKLKRVSQPTRLTLAHRFNAAKPLASGIWNLKIYNKNQHCLDYKFLIFDNYSFQRGTLSQLEYNKFYTVTKKCFTPPHNQIHNYTLCSEQDWTNQHES